MSTQRRPVYAMDCETDPFDGTTDIRPFLWDFFDGKKHHTCESVSDAHAFVEAHPGIYFAHNGGRFDFLMGSFASKADIGQELLMIGGRLARFTMLGSEFRDSFCILPSPLSSLGTAKASKKEIDYAKLSRANRKKHMSEIIEYLHADTATLWHAVSAFRGEYGNGITLAGAALRQFRHCVLGGSQVPCLSASQDAIVREYYYGGRVEAMVQGHVGRPFKVYDIASAYPRAMMEVQPWGNSPIVRSFKRGEKIAGQRFYTVECDSFGALPRIEKGEGLAFPSGRGQFKCTGWELLAGLETDTIRNVNVLSVLQFSEGMSFAPYVKKYYKLKEESPKGSHARLFAKLLLNSAYGKLGCNPDNYERTTTVATAQEAMAHAASGEYRMHAAPLGGDSGPWLVSRDLDSDEKKYLHVGAAASITGWVRAYLWRAIAAARRRGAIYYCDTDSIACDAEMKTGTALGDWTLDADCTDGWIGGKKLYAFRLADGGWKTASKGARLSPSEIVRVSEGESTEWKSSAPTLRAGALPRVISRRIRKR